MCIDLFLFQTATDGAQVCTFSLFMANVKFEKFWRTCHVRSILIGNYGLKIENKVSSKLLLIHLLGLNPA